VPVPVAAFLGPLESLPTPAGSLNLANGAAEAGGRGKDIDGLKMAKQLEDNWCWAAVIQAILERDGATSIAQERIAVDHIRRSGRPRCDSPHRTHRNGLDCQPGACAANCNDLHSLKVVMNERECFRTVLSTHPNELQFQQVKDEVEAERPIACRVDHNGSGHFVLISGWSIGSDGKPRVKVLDPASGADRGQVPSNDMRFRDFLRRYPFSDGTGWVSHSYGVV
jgi:hypothetical protein